MNWHWLAFKMLMQVMIRKHMNAELVKLLWDQHLLHSIINKAELETGRGDKFLTFAFIVRTAGFLPLDIVFPQIP